MFPGFSFQHFHPTLPHPWRRVTRDRLQMEVLGLQEKSVRPAFSLQPYGNPMYATLCALEHHFNQLSSLAKFVEASFYFEDLSS